MTFLRAALLALLASLALRAQLPAELPIAIDRNSDLGFGSLVSAGGGTVTVSPAGARWADGGTTLGSPAGVAPASFSVSGDPGLAFSIVLPSTATLSSGSASMTVDAFTSSPAGTGTLDTAGQGEVRVGATLQVGASQASGSYSGTFSVTVAYN